MERVGESIVEELGQVFSGHPNVGDIRGRGLLLGIELVEDRESKTPADPALASRIKNRAMQEGLIIYPGGGTADGRTGAHVLLAPPFIYATQHVDELVGKLAAVLGDITGGY